MSAEVRIAPLLSGPRACEVVVLTSALLLPAQVETLQAVVKDPEVEIIMKRANVGVLEAAEAMEKCAYQPRKALQILASMQQVMLPVVSSTNGGGQQRYTRVRA